MKVCVLAVRELVAEGRAVGGLRHPSRQELDPPRGTPTRSP